MDEGARCGRDISEKGASEAAAAPRFLAIGAVMADIACEVERLPRSGEGVVPTSVEVTLGGCALNSVLAARRHGVTGRLFAPVGTGIFAGLARRRLNELGVASFEPAEPAGDNGAAVCLVEPGGERTMITLPGLERRFQPEWFNALTPEETASLICGIACGYELESDGGDAIVGFFERHPHIQMFYAPGPRVCAMPESRVARIKALRAIWHLNDQEACAYTGLADVRAAGIALAREAGAPVIVTAGAEGSYAFVPAAMDCEVKHEGEAARAEASKVEAEPGVVNESGVVRAGTSEVEFERERACEAGVEGDVEVIHVPTEPITPVDTIGAGDAHLGALVAAWVQGASWEQALDQANRAAGQVCQVKGALLED